MSQEPPDARVDQVPVRSTVSIGRRELRSLVLNYLVVAASVGFILLMLLGPFVIWYAVTSSIDGYSDLSGIESQRLFSTWPASVPPRDVNHVSWCSYSTRDSFTTHYRMEMSAEHAKTWQDAIHDGEVAGARSMADQRVMEGLQRTIHGAPHVEYQTGKTPEWWTPPAIEFRTTEYMLWNDETGTARGLYSAYDPVRRTLWVYKYAAQHDHLWPQGQLPQGTVFRPADE